MEIAMVGSIVLAMAAFGPRTAAPAADDGWAWVEPAKPAFAHAPLRALSLSPDAPADVALHCTPEGRASWAQLRFGTVDSRRVALLVVEREDGAVELYADANRDRVVESSEKVAPDSGATADATTWTLPLRVAAANEDLADLPARKLRFRLGAARIALTYAVLGCLEGRVSLAGRSVAVRRVDADGNGLLDDLQDSIWIDLGGTGEWDAPEGRFACAPLVQLEGARWLVRTDPFGRRLALESVEGVATFRFAPAALPAGVKASDLSVTLAARDGSAFLARGAAPTLTLPAGDYRVASLTISLAGKDAKATTTYTFTRDVDDKDANWHAIAAGATADFDPLGTVTFSVVVNPKDAVDPGTVLSIQPRLMTSEGLRIVTATTDEAVIELSDDSSAPRARTRSGFA